MKKVFSVVLVFLLVFTSFSIVKSTESRDSGNFDKLSEIMDRINVSLDIAMDEESWEHLYEEPYPPHTDSMRDSSVYPFEESFIHYPDFEEIGGVDHYWHDDELLKLKNSNTNNRQNTKPRPSFLGVTHYVGGSGPGNYTSIQDAIDASSDGDTVFVYDDSSPYYENVEIRKSINLFGENRDTTVIDGNGISDVVYISDDWVNINGFTIQNAGSGIEIDDWYNNIHIINNKISNNKWEGIDVSYDCDSNIISGNIITNNDEGISFNRDCYNNTISGNYVINNGLGIYLRDCSNNIISGNIITNNDEGIFFNLDCYNNTISGNYVINNGLGIYLRDCSNNIIFNNYFNNENNAKSNDGSNIWNITKTSGTNIMGGPYLGGNYWYDYNGKDKDGDGIGDTNLPYDCFGGIEEDGDWLPLVIFPPLHLVYVDDDYDNSTPGWGYDHFDQIQDGIDAVSRDGSVIVYSGTYYESLKIKRTINLVGENKNTTIIDASGSGYVIGIHADWVNISGFTIQNGSNFGVIIKSDNNIIEDNNIVNNQGRGIYLSWLTSSIFSRDNKVIGNNIANNYYGIALQSHNNSIIANTISDNTIGVALFDRSNDNIFLNNTLINNGFYIGWFYVYRNIVEGNTVNGKPLIYLEEESDIIVNDEVGQVILIRCDNISIQGQKLCNATVGIQLWLSNNCTISDNTISNNYVGIEVIASSNNKIFNDGFDSMTPF